MNRAAWTLAATLVFTGLVLSGCGYISTPLPPALEIPVHSTDLRAAEVGENIEVTFTVPALTTDGLTLKSVNSVELRVTPAGAAPAIFQVPGSAPGLVDHTIPARDFVGKDVTLAVRASGPKRKPSAWSNEVALHIEIPLARPDGLTATAVERGVQLKWRGSSSRYRIFRAVEDQQPERLNESDGPEFLDETSQYGTRYRYLVQAIAGETQGSEVSEPATITPKDQFPPGVPAGLSVVAGPGTMELAWTRNTEPDFQGYNVFRSTEGGPFEKIASLIPAPAFSDRQVEAGKKYRYTVSAVDTAGNESQPSPPQEATAQ